MSDGGQSDQGSSTRRKMLAAREDIANRIVDIAKRKDMTIYQTVNDILEQALRVEEMGLTMRQVVDERWMLERARETGFSFTIEYLLYQIVDQAYFENKEQQTEIWKEMGHWYGRYFKTKHEDPLEALTEALDLFTFGSSEYSIENKNSQVTVSCVGERYSDGYTELFSLFLEEVFNVLDYKLTDKETGKGIIQLSFKK